MHELLLSLMYTLTIHQIRVERPVNKRRKQSQIKGDKKRKYARKAPENPKSKKAKTTGNAGTNEITPECMRRDYTNRHTEHIASKIYRMNIYE